MGSLPEMKRDCTTYIIIICMSAGRVPRDWSTYSWLSRSHILTIAEKCDDDLESYNQEWSLDNHVKKIMFQNGFLAIRFSSGDTWAHADILYSGRLQCISEIAHCLHLQFKSNKQLHSCHRKSCHSHCIQCSIEELKTKFWLPHCQYRLYRLIANAKSFTHLSILYSRRLHEKGHYSPTILLILSVYSICMLSLLCQLGTSSHYQGLQTCWSSSCRCRRAR